MNVSLSPVWRTSLDHGIFLPRHPPLLVPGSLIVRAGSVLLRLSLDDGAVEWSSRLGDRSGDGRWLLVVDDVVVTDVTEYRRGWGGMRTVISACSLAGELHWRHQLDTVPESTVAVGLGNRVVVSGLLEGGETVLFGIDTDSGELSGPELLPWPLDGFCRTPSRLLAWTRSVRPDQRSLHAVDPLTLSPSPLPATAPASGPGCWHVTHAGSVVVGVERFSEDEYLARVLDVTSLAQLWTARVQSDHVAVDDTHLYSVVNDELTARSARNGELQWQVPANGALTMACAGPVLLVRSLGANALVRVSDGLTLSKPAGPVSAAAVDSRTILLLQTGSVEKLVLDAA